MILLLVSKEPSLSNMKCKESKGAVGDAASGGETPNRNSFRERGLLWVKSSMAEKPQQRGQRACVVASLTSWLIKNKTGNRVTFGDLPPQGRIDSLPKMGPLPSNQVFKHTRQ